MPPPPKQGEIKIDTGNLPKIELIDLKVPRPPPVKTGADLRHEAEQEAIKDLVAFDLSKEFDQETYAGRVQF